MIERKANRYQQRFYLEWVLDRTGRMYNTPLVYEVEEMAGKLDEAALSAALGYFVNRYDSGCRSRFYEKNDEIFELIAEHKDVELSQLEGAAGETMESMLSDELAYCFNLETGPLFRFTLLRAEQRTVLVFNFR